MRLLFIYGFEPSGHASAAMAVEEAARARGLETARVNVSEHHAWLGPFVAKAYLALIQRFPKAWRVLYDSRAVASVAQHWRSVYLALNHRRLERTLRRLAPDVIVCTHAPPLGALALQKERGRLACPLAGVVTDFKAHSYWVRRGADLYLVPTEETASDMVSRGISAARVKVTGIPIHPTFAKPIDRASARSRLGLPESGPVLFLSGGSRGLGQLAGIAKALLARFPNARLLAATGNNGALLRFLKARYRRDHRLWVYPGLDALGVKELMSAADLLVGKAGGLTTAECLALGLPMVFFDPIPGQESYNAQFLVRQGAAFMAPSLTELPQVVSRALEPRTLAALRAGALALGRPDSARRVLEAVLSLTAGVN